MKLIEINNKEYPLHYGLDFIREMDKRYTVNTNGFTFGVGVQSGVIYLTQGNPVVLEDIILSATHTLKQSPSKEEIEQWIEEQEDLEVVFDGFLKSFKSAFLLKTQTNRILDEMEK